MDNKYFASLPSDQIVQELKARVERYYRQLEESGRSARLKKAYSYYYGNDGSKSSHEVKRGGSQGELHLVRVNDFRNLIQHLLVMTTQSRPALECRAANTDYKSMAQAQLGNGLLEYYLREKKLEGYLRAAVETALILDEGFVHLEWDTSIGEDVAVDPESGQILKDGDIKVSNLTPFDVIRDPFRTKPEQDWYILRIPTNKFDLAAKYPDKAEQIISTAFDHAQSSFIDYTQNENGSDTYSYVFYHEKTASMPQGRLVLFVGNENLLDVPLPYKEIPVYRMAAADVIGTIFGYSPGADLLALQEISDSLHSTIISNQLNFGVQSLIGPKGADISVSQLGEGMTYFELDPALVDKLKPLNLTSTPIEIFNYLGSIGDKMETLAGINSVTRGNPEASLKSGAALALVQSMSIQFNSGLQASYSQLAEASGTGIIRMLQSFAKSPRIAAITGKNSRYMLKEFTSSDIDKISRVMVDVANPLSKTIAGRLEMARDLLQNQLIKRPEQYIAVLTTGRHEPLFEDEMAELMTIRAENEFLSDGKSVPVVITDNHPQHILCHKSVIANPESRLSPDVLNAALAHIQEHIDQMQNADPRLLTMLQMQPLPPMAMPLPPQGADAPQPPQNQPSPPAPGNEMPRMPTNPLSGNKFDPETGGLP